MHDDDNRFQRFVPLLRRVIILLAVLAATPVILWMITAFVRAYVGPPKVPTFRQLASTTPMAAPATAAASTNSDQPSAAPPQAKVADITASTTDAAATTSDARDAPLPKGSLLSDRLPPDGSAPAPGNLSTMAPASAVPSPLPASTAPATPMKATTAETPAGGQSPIAQQSADNAATAEVSQPPAAAEQQADAMPPAPPLTGKIPLPRHRPRHLGETNMAQLAQGAVPMPRPRPDGAGPAAPAETTSAGPLDFLQNLFH